MKKHFFSIAMLAATFTTYAQEVQKDSIKSEKLDEVVLNATRANKKTPITFNNLTKKDLKKQNLGQDLPILLDQLPSVVTTSDAGAGVGYTGLRVRGSDASRINVTINGIPYNDSESHGTYWVNMPDFSSSVEDIQLQRGAGTSTNGSGAFGASLNITTSKPSEKSFVSISNSFGSYNTRKHNLLISTGLNNGFYGTARISRISSDGYIDRSESNLKSYFLETGYLADNTEVKAMIFGGHEITNQAWYGTPEAVINKDLKGIKTFLAHEDYAMSEEQIKNMKSNPGRTFNWYTYDNEIDDYQQTHYQLHATHRFDNNYTLKLSGNYTRGKGYFEQYKNNKKVKKFLANATNPSEKGDVILRRWLDNHFKAIVYSLSYKDQDLDLVLGGGVNLYDGDHYGKIIWDSFPTEQIDYKKQYYFSTGLKNEFNTYLKAGYDITEDLYAYADVQYRVVNHKGKGTDNKLNVIDFDKKFNFFNPKLGLTFKLGKYQNVYGSFAIANREPNRGDLTKVGVVAKPENLQDFEVGYRFKNALFYVNTNFYYMNYKDQLILTGNVDDVGENIKENVDKSYRKGIELQAGYKLNNNFKFDINATFSENKIKEFKYMIQGTEYDDSSNETYFTDVKVYNDTDISFSPNIIANGKLTYSLTDDLSFSWISKYVGKQYLDNTGSEDKKMDSYFVNNFNAQFNVKQNLLDELSFTLLINNILSQEYNTKGYTYSYYYRKKDSNSPVITEKFFYPQATRNFLLGVTMKF